MLPTPEAICEAVRRPTMRFVQVKSAAQQSPLMLHRTRDLLMRQRTQVINAFRAHLAFETTPPVFLKPRTSIREGGGNFEGIAPARGGILRATPSRVLKGGFFETPNWGASIQPIPFEGVGGRVGAEGALAAGVICHRTATV